MNEDLESTIQDLLDEWERLRRQGVQVSAVELCADHPHLEEVVREQIEGLVRFERFDSQSAMSSIGDYRLLGRIGYGATSDVYLCQKTPLRRKSALKLLRNAIAGSTAMERFRREAELISELSHPFIVPLYDFGESDDGRPYFVMEYVNGQSITEWASTKDPHDILGAVQDVLRALEAAHQRGVIHCDIKPTNVMVDSEDNVKLLDFGVSKALSKDLLTITQDAAQTALGSFAYMAPEQLRGRKTIDQRVDVFGVGALLFELLTRESFRSLEGLGWEQVMQSIRHGKPKRVRDVKQDIDPKIAAIVDQATSKNARLRYRTAREFREDIGNYLDGNVVGANARRRNNSLIRGVFAGLACAAVIVFATEFLPDISRSIPKPNNNAVSEEIQGVTTETVRLVKYSEAETVQQTEYSSGVGSCVGFAPDNPVGGIEWLHDTARCAKANREFSWHFLLWCHRRTHGQRQHASVPTALLWDEAHERFFFGDNQGKLGYYSHSMQEYVELEFGLGARTNDLAISPDGSTLVAVSKKGTSVFYDLETLERLPISLADDVKLCKGIWYNAAGSKLITVHRSGRIATWSTSDGKLLNTWKVDHQVTCCDYSPRTDQLAMADPETGFRIGDVTQKLWSKKLGEVKTTGLKFDQQGKSILESTTDGFSVWDVDALQLIQRHPLEELFQPFDVKRAVNDSNWVFRRKSNGLNFVRQRENYRIGRLIQCGVVAGYDVSDDGRWVVYGRSDKNVPDSQPAIGRWDLRPWKARQVVPTAGQVKAMECSTDGTRLIFATGDGLQEARLGNPTCKLLSQADDIRAIRVLKTGTVVYATETEVVTLDKGSESRRPINGVSKIAGTEDELILATQSGSVLRIAGNVADELGICDEEVVWLGTRDKTALALTKRGILNCYFDDGEETRFDLGAVPKSARLVVDNLYVVGEGKVLKFDIVREEMTETDLEIDSDATLLAISPDGRTLAFANDSGTLGFLDPVVGTRRYHFEKSFDGSAQQLDFSADGKVIYVVGGDDQIHVWTPFEFN